MSEQERPESTAYRAGRSVGIVIRVAVGLFAFGVVAIASSSAFPDPWASRISVAALGLGAFAALVLGLVVRNWFWTAMGAYIVLVGLGSVLQDQEPQPRGALIAISAGTIVALLAALGIAIRAGRRSRELDRLIFSESTSVAFFATMLGAVTYALLEAWLEAPKLSMWLVWGFGMGSWIVASTLFRRRYA